MAGVIAPVQLMTAVDKVYREAGYQLAKSGKCAEGKDVASWIVDICIELKCRSVQLLPQGMQEMHLAAKSKPGKPYDLDIVFQELKGFAG